MKRLLLLALPCLVGACRGPAPSPTEGPRSEVLVLGMIHGDHRTSETYGLPVVEDILRTLNPDYVLAEIPPDRLPLAAAEFAAEGLIREPRVSRFPEYVDVLFPLTRELDFEIVPCAAWTRPMADARRARLASLADERPAEHAEMERGMAWIEGQAKAEGLAQDPLGIHTLRYDALVEAGLEPYDRHFNDDLGPGGWTNINRAHWALVEAALDRHRGEGKRFVVTFGAWHKYWILDRLRERGDVQLLELGDLWAP